MAIEAMHCRFELVLYGPDPITLRAAGEEACEAIRKLDRLLNVFSPASEISKLNRSAGDCPVRVSALLFDALNSAIRLWRQTHGAFDPSAGPIIQLWRKAKKRGVVPSDAELLSARRASRMEDLLLDPDTRTVAFRRPGLELNLNAIAKGLALDEAGILLRETGVESALLHGGTSSGLAIGAPPHDTDWPIGLADPWRNDRIAYTLHLRDSAWGMAGQHLQNTSIGGVVTGHVIDPRNGRPIQIPRAAVAIASNAASADALSTALLVDAPSTADWLLLDEAGLMLVPGDPDTTIHSIGNRITLDHATRPQVDAHDLTSSIQAH